MRMRCLAACVAVGTFCFVMGQAAAGDMRTGVRLTYLQAIYDIADWHDDNIPNSEVDVVSPVGLSVAPAYELDSGLQIWGDLGPGIIILGDIEFWCVPVSAGMGYSFISSADTSPYVKIGVRYPIAGGDFHDRSSLGVLAAAGVEFLKQKKVGIVVELGYDTSTVTLERSGSDDIEGGFTASVGAVF